MNFKENYGFIVEVNPTLFGVIVNNSNVLEKGVEIVEQLDGILYPQTDLETYNELIKNTESFKKKAD